MILGDTNVLMDLVTDDPCGPGGRSSSLTLRQLAKNEIVYAEQSIGYERMEELDAMIHSADLVNALMSRPALFLAGKAFQRYRSADGRKTGILPDFFIGAHAVVTRRRAVHPRYISLSQLLSGDHPGRAELRGAPTKALLTGARKAWPETESCGAENSDGHNRLAPRLRPRTIRGRLPRS